MTLYEQMLEQDIDNFAERFFMTLDEELLQELEATKRRLQQLRLRRNMGRRRRKKFDIEKVVQEARVRQTKESLAAQHECPVWITADQELIPLKVMSLRHMKNIMNMLYCRLLTNKTFLEAVQKMSKKKIDPTLMFDAMTAYETYEQDMRWMNDFYAELDRRELTYERFNFQPLYPRSWLVVERNFF